MARAAPAAEETATVPRFELAQCPKLPGAEELAKASCGYLVVSEDRSQPNGRTIRLMVAKYPARSPEKRPDPVVYLAGGPGDIAPLEVNGLIAADFIRDRDIYVVSQRGTMFSESALTCAAADAFARELSNATMIGIPGVGHAVSPASPCAQAVVVSFLADPAAPDTSCVGALKPPSFTSVGSP